MVAPNVSVPLMFSSANVPPCMIYQQHTIGDKPYLPEPTLMNNPLYQSQNPYQTQNTSQTLYYSEPAIELNPYTNPLPFPSVYHQQPYNENPYDLNSQMIPNPYYTPHHHFTSPIQISVGPLVSESSEPWKLFEERDQIRRIVEQKLELSFYPMDWCVNFESLREILLERYPELKDDLSSPSSPPFESKIEAIVLQTPPPTPTSMISPLISPPSLENLPPLATNPSLDKVGDSKVDKNDEPILLSLLVVGLSSMENQEPNKKYKLQGGQEETKHGIAKSSSIAVKVCSPNPSHFCASNFLCEQPSKPAIVLFAPVPKLPLPIQHATTIIRTEKNIQNLVGHRDPSHAHKVFDLFSNPAICQQNKLIQAYSSQVCYHHCFFVKFPPARPPLKPPDTPKVLGPPQVQHTSIHIFNSKGAELEEEEERLFSEMQKAGAAPDEVTMVSVISATSGPLGVGKWVHAFVEKQSIGTDLELSTELVNMYAKCGCNERAKEVFDAKLLFLRILALGIKDMQTFDYVDARGAKAIDTAIKNLSQLVVVTSEHDGISLTEEGQYLARLGIDPWLGKFILSCFHHRLGREGIVLAAVMANASSIFFRVGNEEESCSHFVNSFGSEQIVFAFHYHNGGNDMNNSTTIISFNNFEVLRWLPMKNLDEGMFIGAVLHMRPDSFKANVGPAISFISLSLVLITGGLTEMKSKDMLMMKQDEEWVEYKSVIDDVIKKSRVDKSNFYDPKGSHDNSGVPVVGGSFEFYAKYSINGPMGRSGKVNSITIKSEERKHLLVGLDNTMSFDLQGPTNLFGHPTHQLLSKVDSKLSRWNIQSAKPGNKI